MKLSACDFGSRATRTTSCLFSASSARREYKARLQHPSLSQSPFNSQHHHVSFASHPCRSCLQARRSSSGAYTRRRYRISLTLTSDKTRSRNDHASTSPRRPTCTQPTRTQKIRQHIALHSRWCSRHRRRWILLLHPRARKGRPSQGQGQGRGGEAQAKVSGDLRQRQIQNG